MTSATIREAAREVTGLLPPGDVVALHLRGVDVHVHVSPVADEQIRRQDVGLGALPDRAALETLAALPADLPVPLARLESASRRRLLALPAGCLRVADDAVIRELVPPVRVNAAMLLTPSWRNGLRHASRFSPFCARSIILTREPRRTDHSLLLLQALRFGLGVACVSGDSLDWIVHPAPFAARRRTSASWLFEEEVFARTL